MDSTNQKILFLSDVHLGGFDEAENRRIESSLIQLLDYCERESFQVCVLGDLFDYWMEYPNHIPRLGRRLLERFASFNRQVGPTLYVTGNHDNWTDGYFGELGFDVEPDFRKMTLDSRNLLLLHGDGITNQQFDINRPPMHRLLRNDTFIRFYQSIFPPRAGLLVMKYFSRLNRYLEDYRADKKKLNKWAESKLKQTETDVIICGHDHFPRYIKFDFGTYINLGTFFRHRTLAVYNKGEFSLVVWSDVSREPKPYHPEMNSYERN